MPSPRCNLGGASYASRRRAATSGDGEARAPDCARGLHPLKANRNASTVRRIGQPANGRPAI
eukprot:6762594-Pyramimonas_sp.AAC.1